MARKNSNVHTQPHFQSDRRPPVKGDNSVYVKHMHSSEFLGIRSPTYSDTRHALPSMTAGSPYIHSTEENNYTGMHSATMDVALNRNVQVSASGPGWIIGAGMALMRLMAKISGHGVTISLSRDNGRRGPSA